MRCNKCAYETNNKKSMANHRRYGCHGYIKNKQCLYCDRILHKRQKPKEQGKFCDRRCYSLWRSQNLKADKAPNYKDGKCNERQLLRSSLQYKEWRTAVFRRDSYTCQKCGDNNGGNLVADHIKSFALFPELRFDTTNGRTLCRKCHKETDNYGYTKHNSKRTQI